MAGFEEKADDADEEKREGAGGGGVAEGGVEDKEEGRGEEILIVSIKLIGKAIKTRNRATLDRGES